MPFLSVTQLPADPLVRIFFSGQFILQSPPSPHANERRCEVFVNRAAADHHLSVEIRGRRPGTPDVILMRHFGPLAFTDVLPHPPRTHGMFIQVEGATAVKRYDGAPAGGASALGDAIDLTRLHMGSPPPNLGVDQRGGRPSILIDDGVFYTAMRTERRFVLSRPVSQPTVITNFASLVGVSIESRVTVRWNQAGVREQLLLEPNPRLPDLRYEIYVTNDPLYEEEAQIGIGIPLHDELKEYYKILPGVTTNEQFSLTPEDILSPPSSPPASPPASPAPAGSSGDRGSTRTPCMPVIIGP